MLAGSGLAVFCFVLGGALAFALPSDCLGFRVLYLRGAGRYHGRRVVLCRPRPGVGGGVSSYPCRSRGACGGCGEFVRGCFQIVALVHAQLVHAQLAERTREEAHASAARLPVALLAASFVTTVASTALPRLGVVVVALVASPAWVGPASLFAALAAFLVPLVVYRADGWSLRAVSALSVLSAAVWLVAPAGVVVVACGAVSSFVGGVVDGQVDSRAAVGSDPSASLARLQTAQAFVAAGTGLVVAPMLEVLSPASLAAAISGFVLLGTCVVSYVESRFPVV